MRQHEEYPGSVLHQDEGRAVSERDQVLFPKIIGFVKFLIFLVPSDITIKYYN